MSELFKEDLSKDADGNPRGGIQSGDGFLIYWGPDTAEKKGAKAKDVLKAVNNWLKFCKKAYPFKEISLASDHVNKAVVQIEIMERKIKQKSKLIK